MSSSAKFRMLLSSRAELFQRIWPLFYLLLSLATWRLWWGQTAFPQVPLLTLFTAVPRVIDSLLLVVSVAAAFTAAFSPNARKPALSIFAICLALLVGLDQHRLQPWAYQFLIYALLGVLVADQRLYMMLLRILVVSIYFYSALGKLDYQFLHTVGQQMLGQFAELLRQDWSLIGPQWRVRLAFALPLSELAVAALLAVPPLRTYGAAAATVLHGMLLLILGPWGLGHAWGVLIWNTFFIAQAWLLFGPARREMAGHPSRRMWSKTGTVAIALTMLVIGLPLLERYGWWDHWTSWALYSPHSSRVTVEVFRPAAHRLSPDLRPYLSDGGGTESWQRLEIDSWSLDALAVPIYPQARFQLGVATALQQSHAVPGLFRFRVRSAASRRDGTRSEVVLGSSSQLRQAAESFWLNTEPRSLLSGD